MSQSDFSAISGMEGEAELAEVAGAVWPDGRMGDNSDGNYPRIVPMSTNNSPNNVQLPTDEELVLKVIPMPADCNANGDIFGGWVMAQVDLAGSVVPARYTQGRMATVAVNEFIFKQPVRVGDILSFFSKVSRIGRTSITVKVEVYAERYQSQKKYVKVTEASLTYVAIDDNGKPREIPKP